MCTCGHLARSQVSWVAPRMQARMHNIYASSIAQTGGNVPINNRTVVLSTYHPFWNAGVNGSNEVRTAVHAGGMCLGARLHGVSHGRGSLCHDGGSLCGRQSAMRIARLRKFRPTASRHCLTGLNCESYVLAPVLAGYRLRGQRHQHEPPDVQRLASPVQRPEQRGESCVL